MRMRVIWVALMAASLAFGASFEATIVDGLGRPVADVNVQVSCGQRRLMLRSDANGKVEGEDRDCAQFSRVCVRRGEEESCRAGGQSRYVIKKEFPPEEIARVAKLDAPARREALRELLAGEIKDVDANRSRWRDLLILHCERLRPGLRELARDEHVAERARDWLALIGDAEDLRFIVQLPAITSDDPGFPDRWRYSIALALVDPKSEEEWTFLRKCADNEYDDRWVDAGAIQALKLIARPRSIEILEEARTRNPSRAALIGKAIEYAKSNPQPLADRNLVQLAERVAKIIQLGDWEGNSKPAFSEAGDRALIDFRFQTSEDSLVYTAAFQKIDGVWRFRGARETMQGFSIRGTLPVKH